MKKSNLSAGIFLLILLSFTFQACTKSSDEPVKDETNKITLKDLQGVWTDGIHFISINQEENFFSAFLPELLLDCGAMKLNGEILTVSNSYFNRSIDYDIISLSNDKLNLAYTYIDVYGNEKSEKILVLKTNQDPAIKENPMVSKSVSWVNPSFGTVTYTFNTYCTGLQSASEGTAKNYPLNLFYLYQDGKCYLQKFKGNYTQIPTIGGWTDNLGNGAIMVYKVGFDNTGNIYGLENIETYKPE